MKTASLLILPLACALTARADFSYVQTQKSTGGMAAMAATAAAANATTKHFLKGQKLKTDTGSTSIIMDFDTQTVTTINHTQKTVSVKTFAELGQMMNKVGGDVKIDVKETGQHKTVNGFNANQVVMTMTMQGMNGAPAGTQMTMEMEMWLSPDVPGSQQLRTFYEKNAERFPWAAIAGGQGSPQMTNVFAEIRKKAATMHGMPVMQIVRMKAGGPAMDAQMKQAQAGMAEMQAKIEEMKKQGGQQAQMAEMLAGRMGALRGGSGASLFEVTMESSGFSTASIPDSEFAIPAGYQTK
jgi:hypothetical protein